MTETTESQPRGGLLSAFAPFRKPFWVINGVELFERGAYYGMLGILSTFLAADLGAPAWLRGVLLAVQFPLLYFLPVVAGALADKFGYKNILYVTFAALIGGYAVLALAPSLWVAFGGIVLFSIGAGLFKPIPAAVVTDTTSEKDRGFGFAIYYWMINLGAFLAPFGMQQVFRGDLRPYFLVSAALSVLNLAIILAAWKDIKPAQPSIRVGESLRRIGEIRKYPTFAVLLVIYSGFWFMYAITTSFMQNYATDYGIMDTSQVALLISVNALAILVFGPILSKATGKLPALPLMIVGITIFCGGFLLIGFVPLLWALLAGVVIFSIGEFLTHPSYLNYVSKVSPADKVPLFFGFGFLPIGVGQMLGTLSGGVLYGFLAEDLGRPQLFWVAIISVGLFTVAGLLVYNLALTRAGRAPAPEPAPRRRLPVAPILAAGAILLVPALVMAGTSAQPLEATAGDLETLDAASLVTLALATVEDETLEADFTAVPLALPANATGNASLVLTWTDEAPSGPGRVNQPDQFRLLVRAANGTIVGEAGPVANAQGQEGKVEVTFPAMPGEYVVEVHNDGSGDHVVTAGPLALPQGATADGGNAWTLAASHQASA